MAKAESELNTFFNLSLDLLCICGQDKYFQKLNPAWERVLGWTLEELMSRPWIEFVHLEDMDATLTASTQSAENAIVHFENRYLCQDGSYRWLSWRTLPHQNGCFYAVAKDITEHKTVELELQQLTAQVKQQSTNLDQILSASPDRIYLIDRAGKYADTSLAGAQALGFQRSDMVGKTGQELGLQPENMGSIEAHHQTVFSTGQPMTGEACLPTTEGFKHYEYIITPIQNPDASVDAILSTVRDITSQKWAAAALKEANEELEKRVEERTAELQQVNEQLRDEISQSLRHAVLGQRAEAARRESEERFRRVFDDAPIGITLVRKPDCQFFMVNRAFCEILGYTESELIALNLFEINHPEDLETETPYLKQVIQGDIDSYQLEKRYIKKNQEICWVKLTATVIRNEIGEVLYELGMVEDITERKRADAEIRNAMEKERELCELRSRFVTTVSHEFRTPLSIIILSARLLERFPHQATEEKKREYFARIQAAAKNMTHLLDDVLFIGKAEAKKLAFNPAPLDLEKFCRGLVEDIQVTISKQHAIAFACQGQTTHFCMDEKLLRQIFTNLLSNAIKYSPKGGNIRFDLVCEQGTALFLIRDQGIGIPPEARTRLFESFHRADNVGTIQGTGLGLSIVKNCVDLHGGKIAVNSEIGVGTTFAVTLYSSNCGSKVEAINSLVQAS
nr:PAS domain S-box protein [Coleofasciculus sp. FACHB-1120]